MCTTKRAVSGTTLHSDGDMRAGRSLLDAKIQTLGLAIETQDAAYSLVTTDDKMNVWNRWHGGTTV